MTTEALPETNGPVQLLEADPEAMVTASRRSGRSQPGPGTPAALELAYGGISCKDVSRIRHLAHDFLARLDVPSSLREDALLVISELVTNAATHALPPTALRIRCDPCTLLRIEVTDGGPQLHQPPRTDPTEEHGRGMCIVASLASRHGTATHENGATRWAELISGAPSDP
ncbi:ATP-binding protein [Streptomyces chartreusis]|uniref:ATP-binding protein n=1 Tax=Streptomyces chartreusis TaxID=1969 RepID=UPI003413D614